MMRNRTITADLTEDLVIGGSSMGGRIGVWKGHYYEFQTEDVKMKKKNQNIWTERERGCLGVGKRWERKEKAKGGDGRVKRETCKLERYLRLLHANVSNNLLRPWATVVFFFYIYIYYYYFPSKSLKLFIYLLFFKALLCKQIYLIKSPFRS